MQEFLDSIDLWLPGVLIMLGLMVLSCFFSASETALFYLTHDELRAFRSGKPQQRVVARLLGDPDRLLTAILFWNLIVNLLCFAVSVLVGQKLAAAEQPLAAGVFSLFGLIGVILIGEVLPKSVAVAFPRFLSGLVAWPLAFMVRLVDPILPLLLTVSRSLRRTFWKDLRRETHLEAADLEKIVEITHGTPEAIEHERQTLHHILDLSEISVEEVMRPRGSYGTLTAPVSLEQLRQRRPQGDYVMILERGTDDVIAALSLRTLSRIPETGLEQLAEEVIHVPWCATLALALEQLRGAFCDLAAVVNEYGETIGVITQSDILDTILLVDASRTRRLLKREPVIEVSAGRWHVEGITTLRYLSRRLGMPWEADADGLITVAGMVYDALEELPEVGDTLEWRGWRIKVIEVYRPGQFRTLFSRIEPQQEPQS